jgi:two-component sensor histidine kinase
VKLTWTETDGPKVVSVQDPGTGTSLLEGLVDHEMNGTITIEFNETGLVCQIEVPLTQVD